MTEEQIKAMAERFLSWKLPTDFNPDGGIKFDSDQFLDGPWWPIGTNLLTYTQAVAMVRHMAGSTTPPAKDTTHD